MPWNPSLALLCISNERTHLSRRTFLSRVSLCLGRLLFDSGLRFLDHSTQFLDRPERLGHPQTLRNLQQKRLERLANVVQVVDRWFLSNPGFLKSRERFMREPYIDDDQRKPGSNA